MRGVMPAQVMLTSMRYYWKIAAELLAASKKLRADGDIRAAEEKDVEYFDMLRKAFVCALDAAPFFHPRLGRTPKGSHGTPPPQMDL